jgi:hypothetical protein
MRRKRYQIGKTVDSAVLKYYKTTTNQKIGTDPVFEARVWQSPV